MTMKKTRARKNVIHIRDRVLTLDEWAGYDINDQCAEMTGNARGLFLYLGFRAIEGGFEWETVDIHDEVLDTGAVASRPAAKAAAEASAKRILLAA